MSVFKQGLMALAAVAATAASTSGAILIDGVADAGYGSAIATDASGDLASPGPADWSGVAWADLSTLRVANDATNLYIHVGSAAFALATSEGTFGITLDVKNTAAGGTTDPWGNAITFGQTNLPDFVVRGDTPKTGAWVELRQWNGTNFNTGGGTNYGGVNGATGVGTNVAWSNGNGLEVQIPLATLGLSEGDAVNLLAYATQGGGTKGAYDSTPSGDQSTGWDDATVHTTSVGYAVAAVPEPASLGAVGLMGLGLLRRRRA